MAYRRGEKQPEMPYSWETQSEVIVNEEYHDSDNQIDPLEPDMSPAHGPAPSKKPGLKHHRSTVMNGIQQIINASASTVSLATSRFRNFGKAAEEEPVPAIPRSAISTASQETIVGSKNEDESTSVSIKEFGGGLSWTRINPGCERLALDLFSSYEPSNPLSGDMLHVREMAPLGYFRNLRSLKLTGMLQSYQKAIWEAVWVNPELEELELGMALKPSLHCEAASSWYSIHGDWEATKRNDTSTRYFGDTGHGRLHHDIGDGEYLDKVAISEAKAATLMIGVRLRRLPVVNLTLSGFVVDADPFAMWFDPRRLRTIDFKRDCVDAGFALPSNMAHITIFRPDYRECSEFGQMVGPQQFKLVELRHGKAIAGWDPTKVGRRLREIQKQFEKEDLKRAKAQAKNAKDKKSKGKEVDDDSCEDSAQYILDQALPFDPTAPPSSPRCRAMGLVLYNG